VPTEIVKISSERPEPSLIRYAADKFAPAKCWHAHDTFYGLPLIPLICVRSTACMTFKSRSRSQAVVVAN